MVFSSMLFLWIFLPVVLGVNWMLSLYKNNNLSNGWLIVASLFFYSWGEPKYIILMLISIGVNWLFGLLIGKYEKYKLYILIVCIGINLSLLGYYKYFGLIVSTVNRLFERNIAIPQIALPIGISFFTFQALSYVVDVYRGDCTVQKNIGKLALYISFFPQLIAGPIVKYKDIAEQIDNRNISVIKTAEGIRRFIYGLSKKILISNTLGLIVDKIYRIQITEVSTALVWVAALFYTMQIYYDFSGYSDMAIGLGRMFGFEFKENFNYPYTSLSIREFWRRWHISLSTWFREYVYIPLGGNKKGVVRTYLNLGIVFFLTGIWHGAAYSFIFWGLFHGLFSVLERVGLDKLLKKAKPFAYLYTMLVVIVGWVFFRIESISLALKYVEMMFAPWKYKTSIYSIMEFVDGYTLFVFVCAILGMGIVQKTSEKIMKNNKWKYSAVEGIYLIALLLLCIFSLAGNTYNPFIYFRF